MDRVELNYSKNGYLSFLPNATIPDGYDVITDLDLADRSRQLHHTKDYYRC